MMKMNIQKTQIIRQVFKGVFYCLFMKKIIFFILCLICLSRVVSAKSLPDLTLALADGGPATDVLLLTQITQYLSQEEYDNLPKGITKVFSQIDSLDEKVTIVVYYGDVQIIIGEDSPPSYYNFAEDLGDILDEHDVENKVTPYDELETQDLSELYGLIAEEEEIILDEEPIPELYEENFTEPKEVVEEPVVEEISTNFISRLFSWFKSWF